MWRGRGSCTMNPSAYLGEHFFFADAFFHPDERRLEAASLAREYLILNVCLAAAVVAYEDGGQMGSLAALGNDFLHFGRYLLLDQGSCCFSVDYLHL